MSAPAGAKKPQDHKKPAPAPGEPIVVEIDGNEYTIAADALDDFEMLDDLARLEDGAGQLFPRILRRLIGDDGFKRAMDALRDPETGRVSGEAGAEFAAEIIQAAANPS